MRFLMDANVVIALSERQHQHHQAARNWLSQTPKVAICPIVEGALARYLLRSNFSAAAIEIVLASFHNLPDCEFWADSLSYRDFDLTRILGHRQVTDTYLAALAKTHGGKLATFDQALARRYQVSVELIPTD